MSSELPPIAPGPADTAHPRRALARLALCYAYYKVADFAVGGVPTVSDEFGDAYDYVDHAARLVSAAQDVLARAVVYARERGGSWSAIAEALDISDREAREKYAATIDHWLSRPAARCWCCHRSVSAGRSPNPACASRRTGLSTIDAVRLCAAG